MDLPLIGTPIAERGPVDRATFEAEVLPAAQPVVLRGQVAMWPLARAALSPGGDGAVAQLLAAHATAEEADALMVPPGRGPTVFFSDDLRGFNYLRNRVALPRLLDALGRYSHFAEPPAVAMQSAPLATVAPALAAAHTTDLVDPAFGALPRLWLGNAIRTPTHFDESHNLAAVVAGLRRFVLFPPEQIGALYPGPIGHAPTGTPISLVDPDAPDLARFPRYAEAAAAARSAVLGPGDVLYIPPLWWHHVASQRAFNAMVNVWWQPVPAASGLATLLQARLAYGAFPPAQRRAWQALLAHWVFEADEATLAHLPAEIHGPHGELTPERRAQLQAEVKRLLGEG